MASAVSGATRAHSREEQLACKVQIMAKVQSLRQPKTPAQVDEEVSSVFCVPLYVVPLSPTNC